MLSRLYQEEQKSILSQEVMDKSFLYVHSTIEGSTNNSFGYSDNE